MQKLLDQFFGKILSSFVLPKTFNWPRIKDQEVLEKQFQKSVFAIINSTISNILK